MVAAVGRRAWRGIVLVAGWVAGALSLVNLMIETGWAAPDRVLSRPVASYEHLVSATVHLLFGWLPGPWHLSAAEGNGLVVSMLLASSFNKGIVRDATDDVDASAVVAAIPPERRNNRYPAWLIRSVVENVFATTLSLVAFVVFLLIAVALTGAAAFWGPVLLAAVLYAIAVLGSLRERPQRGVAIKSLLNLVGVVGAALVIAFV